MRFCLNLFTLTLLCSFVAQASAEQNIEPELELDRSLLESLTLQHGMASEETPIFITAERMEGKKNGQIEAVGKVELRKTGQAIYADSLNYLQNSKDLSAEGDVRVEQDNDIIQSPRLKLNLETSVGNMTQPTFQFGINQAHGKADNLQLVGRNDYVLQNVTYSTCPLAQDDWLLKVRELEIDRNQQLGIAHGAKVEFMGVPILYTPWMDFTLNSQRKSGFLGPVFGSTVKGGSELTLPYYWNIAPNLDATLSPRILSKRGISLNNELRYLEPSYSGEAHLDVLPEDRVANSTRSLLSFNHRQNFGHGLSGSLDINRVSDDAYFRDLSDAVNGTSQTNLLREGVLSYNGGWWNAATRVQSFQTLQDPATPVVVPYRRLPQLSLQANHTISKADLSFAGEFVEFSHPTLIDGQRLVLYPSLSYPLIAQPAFYLTPRLGLHSTYYKMGSINPDNLPDTLRSLPIFSIDSGMTMERNWNLYEKDYVQTLEPRAYYVYIPYQNQNRLPNFDSAKADFSFTQIFTENRFFGSDRIGDANQITLALTSRLLTPDSGVERLRVVMGERFSVITPQVTLPQSGSVTTPVTTNSNKSDILLAASGHLTRSWSLDSAFQFSPNQSQLQQFNVSTRYQPETGKVLNMGYRFTRNSLRQMDISTQWPLSPHWHGVARWNYSFQDGLILEAMGGLEYNRGCWFLRMVAQRFATATQQVSTGIFLQLELNGLVALGSDPLSLLRQSIPGYTKLNDTVSDKAAQGLR